MDDELRGWSLPGVAALLLILVLIPWLPYLGDNTAFLDGLRFMGNASQNSFFLHPARLLTPAPWVLAYGLTPDSFLGAQLLMILVQWGAALALLAVLRLMQFPPRLPLAAALVVTMFYAVFAADTGKFWLGTLSSQSSNLTFLLSVAFFLGYCRRPSPWAALALLLAMAYTLNIHERYYSLIPFVPLLAWPALRKHPLRLLSLWFLVPLLQGLYMVYALLTAQADAYQVSVLAQDETLLVTLTTAASLSVVMLALTLLPPLPAALLPLPLALGSLAGILSAGAVWGWVRKGYAPLRGVLPYLLGGLAIIVLGYLPFSITAEYRDLSTRTLFLSIIGGALVYGVALWFLLRPLPRSTVLLALAVGLVVLLNTERNLVVHSQYRAAAIQNQQQIQQFLDAVGELPPEHLLWVVVDESVNLGNLRYDWFIQAQLTYLYEHPIFVCLMVTGESDLISDSPHCELTANAVHLAPYRERTAAVTVPYSELVIVRVTPDASTRTGYAVALESVLPVAALPFPDSAAAAYQPATVTQPFDAGTRRYRAFADGL